MRSPATVTVAQLTEFDEIVDVRSEGEFTEDHVPGAVNCPALGNDERARVGTIYKQQSPFEAKKIGAALIAANISRHLNQRFLERPRQWRPLFYCWRGGDRSGAFAEVFSRVGWRVGRLDGGYRSYRRAVMADLVRHPTAFRWRVVCGLTGTGKSRLLRTLRAAGGQVLDLEALAAHRGSVLGHIPGAPQPGQKMYESLIWGSLRGFDPKRPVYVEAESKKIGALRVPEALIEQMWKSECIVLEAPVAARLELLKQEYAHLGDDIDGLIKALDCLIPMHGHAIVGSWRELARAKRWDKLINELLARHYDPAYTRAIGNHYSELPGALKLALSSVADAAFSSLARRCLETEKSRGQAGA
ncbi:MAG TPA: tRNA 2-selenouridine(34) synthase MnmH [Burkholderiales bacterium]|nr:tRNA 2-selenouridine(34) synthase MnmH [Burkholderiales bacterium]